MARRNSSDTPRSGRMTLPPPSGECGALQALMNDGSQVTVGSIGDIPAAAIANTIYRSVLRGRSEPETCPK